VELPERVLTGPVVLRHFTLSDATRVRELAGDWEVAKTTAALPHPYRQSMAEDWIAGHAEARDRGTDFSFAITRVDDGALVGSLGLRPDASEHGHFGYWIGRPHWGSGYATAATRAAIALLFAHTDAETLWATHLADNHGSSRVMEKCGMRVLRREARPHRGEPRDFLVRGITRDEWDSLVERPR
jgi:ribosomal-protein-alanine N-acetyltransferase